MPAKRVHRLTGLDRVMILARWDPETSCVVVDAKPDNEGYPLVYDPAHRRKWRAHRIVMEAAHGPLPAGMHTCHWCGNRRCVTLGHLYYGTPAQNAADTVRHGRTTRGRSRLSPEERAAIIADPRLHRVIAAQYGVHPSEVSRMKGGK